MGLLEREIIKVTADSILAVDTLLGNVEVLDVDEIPLANGSDEGTGELLLAICGGVEGEVDGDQVNLVEGSTFKLSGQDLVGMKDGHRLPSLVHIVGSKP